jgi:hypothetical protein
VTITRVFPVFAAAFAVIYVLAVQMNWALVTYHPRLGEWELLTAPPKSGPAMYWYGWMMTAAIGAICVSLAALPLQGHLKPPIWIGWTVPLLVMGVFVYLFRSFFLR